MQRFFKPKTEDPEVHKIIVDQVRAMGPESVDVNSNVQSIDDIKPYDFQNLIDDLYDFLSKFNEQFSEFKGFSFRPKSVYEDAEPDEIAALRYAVVQRTPATMTPGAGPHEGRLMYKGMLMDILEDKHNPGYKVLVYSQHMDNTFQIVPLAKSYRDADRAAQKLEEILETYSYLFKAKGLQALRFQGRGSDFTQNIAGSVFYGCPLTFYARTYKIKLVYEKVLEEIAFTVKTY